MVCCNLKVRDVLEEKNAALIWLLSIRGGGGFRSKPKIWDTFCEPTFLDEIQIKAAFFFRSSLSYATDKKHWSPALIS